MSALKHKVLTPRQNLCGNLSSVWPGMPRAQTSEPEERRVGRRRVYVNENTEGLQHPATMLEDQHSSWSKRAKKRAKTGFKLCMTAGCPELCHVDFAALVSQGIVEAPAPKDAAASISRSRAHPRATIPTTSGSLKPAWNVKNFHVRLHERWPCISGWSHLLRHQWH